MLGLAAYLLGIGVPETYAREIVRRRAKRHGVQHKLPLAESGATLGEMAQIAFFVPLKMLVTEPLVIMISLYLALNFAVLFQWFITVPVALEGAFGFDVRQVGLAFIAAIVGVVMAAVMTGILDRVMAPSAMKKDAETIAMTMNIEYRLYPAMIGCIFIPASLFWVGWTASPSFTWAIPVVGTGVYVCGSALTLVSWFLTALKSLPKVEVVVQEYADRFCVLQDRFHLLPLRRLPRPWDSLRPDGRRLPTYHMRRMASYSDSPK